MSAPATRADLLRLVGQSTFPAHIKVLATLAVSRANEEQLTAAGALIEKLEAATTAGDRTAAAAAVTEFAQAQKIPPAVTAQIVSFVSNVR